MEWGSLQTPLICFSLFDILKTNMHKSEKQVKDFLFEFWPNNTRPMPRSALGQHIFFCILPRTKGHTRNHEWKNRSYWVRKNEALGMRNVPVVVRMGSMMAQSGPQVEHWTGQSSQAVDLSRSSPCWVFRTIVDPAKYSSHVFYLYQQSGQMRTCLLHMDAWPFTTCVPSTLLKSWEVGWNQTEPS